MEFFQELLLFSESMEIFSHYNKHIPSPGSPVSFTAGRITDLDDFLQSFTATGTPPDFCLSNDFETEHAHNSETCPLLGPQSPLPSIEGQDFSSQENVTTTILGHMDGLEALFTDHEKHIPEGPSPSNLFVEQEQQQKRGQQQHHHHQVHDQTTLENQLLFASSNEAKGLLLIHLLIALAEAISNDSRDLAEVILLRLWKLVSSTGSNIERIGFYFYHAFKWLFTGENEIDVKPRLDPRKNFLLAYRVLIEIYPCSRLAQFTANQCILEAIPKDSKKLHVLDFDLIDGLQWPPLMEALVSKRFGVRHIRLTSIKWSNHSEDSSVRTFNRLREFAEGLGFDFSYEEVELEDLANCTREEEEEEVVVANCMFKLFHMLERSTWQVSQFLEASKIFYPRVFTLGYCNFSGENESVDLMSRVMSCLRWASAVCDSLESALPTQQLARQAVEMLFLGPRFCHELMSEKEENTIRNVPDNLGLVRGRISSQNLEQGQYLLRLQAREGHLYRLETVDNNEISLRWGETCLLHASAWHIW